MQSTRSPRQAPFPRRKTKPYHRRPPPTRAASMLSTIKNIVTAPLSWFSTADSFDQPASTQGKRRRPPPTPPNAAAASAAHRRRADSPADLDPDELPSRPKRMRLHSPVRELPRPNTGYLDPPLSVLPHPVRQAPARLQARHTLEPISTHPADLRPRPTAPQGLSRTMSMDPPPHPRTVTREPTFVPLSVSRDVSMDLALPGAHNPPFRMRSGLSPTPPATQFGPNPQRRGRNPSEPPPLTALMSRPVFVRPPPAPDSHAPAPHHPAPVTTLGSLAQAHRSVSATTSPLAFSLTRFPRPRPLSDPAARSSLALNSPKTPAPPPPVRPPPSSLSHTPL